MDYDAYRLKYFVDPPPEEKFKFVGIHGATLFFEDYQAAIQYYQAVLGPPAYVEGGGTRGWRVGNTWLTLLQGEAGSPENVEVHIITQDPLEAERLQRSFIEAGGTGPTPSDELMYEPIRYCPVNDPFGTSLLIYSLISGGDN